MAKWRAIHQKISRSGQVARMSEFAQFLFERAMLHTDDWGVMTGDPFDVKLAAIPASQRSEDEFEAALAEMEEAELIWRYHPDGWGPLIQFINFDDYQPKVLIGNRTDPQVPLHYLHPNYGDYPEFQWAHMEEAGNSSDSMEENDSSKSKSISRSESSKSESVQPKGKNPDTPHHRAVAGYIERIAPGYSKRYKGKFAGDLAKIKAMLSRGHSDADILACYDAFKSERFWAGKHLSMKTIDENIDDWKKAGGKHETHRRRDDGITDEERQIYAVGP